MLEGTNTTIDKYLDIKIVGKQNIWTTKYLDNKIFGQKNIWTTKSKWLLSFPGTIVREFLFLLRLWGLRLWLTDGPHPILTSEHCPFNLLRSFKDDVHWTKANIIFVLDTHACYVSVSELACICPWLKDACVLDTIAALPTVLSGRLAKTTWIQSREKGRRSVGITLTID